MSGTLVIRNRQRCRRIGTSLLRRILRAVLATEFSVSDFELGIHLVNDREMARINERFLNHAGSTDVITFDHAEPGVPASGDADRPIRLHGEIFISVPDAVSQAREFKTTWQAELVRYAIHGLLHLAGYDDLQSAARRKMKRAENRILSAVVQSFPISQIEVRRLRQRAP